MSKTQLPKNFEQILSAAKSVLQIMQEREKNPDRWEKERSVVWIEKVRSFSSLVLEDARFRKLVSTDDLEDKLINIGFYLAKALPAISDKDLERYLAKILGYSSNFRFFFPAVEMFGFPDGFTLGESVLHPFTKLEKRIQKGIASSWKYKYNREKIVYYHRNRTEYKKRKRSETYFCLTVNAMGNSKATEIATRRANQSVNIIRCLYGFTDLPRLRECYWFRDDGSSGGIEEMQFIHGWFNYPAIPEMEKYLEAVTRYIKGSFTDELARRILTALDIFGTIDRETSLEVSFLLTVVAMEALVLSEDDKDMLGLRLREKVAILVGDTPWWFEVFLNKHGPSENERERNRVNARVELAHRISEIYGKRSKFAHPAGGKEKEKITNEDNQFVAVLFGALLQRIISLRELNGLKTVKRKRTFDPQSLDSFIDSQKYSVPLGTNSMI